MNVVSKVKEPHHIMKIQKFSGEFSFSQIELRHVCYVKNSRLRYDLPVSVNNSVILPFR